MKKTFVIIVSLTVLLVGCDEADEADMEGIVLDTTENGLTLARELTPDEYEKIQDISPTKLHNEDVEGKRDLRLITLSYEDIDEIKKGDQVDVWLDGDIMNSYPPQADAKKILTKK